MKMKIFHSDIVSLKDHDSFKKHPNMGN